MAPQILRLKFGMTGKTCAIQRRIKEVARAIAGEHPTGSVRAVRSGREPDDHDPRLRVTKARHRFAPVGFIRIRLAFDSRNIRAVRTQVNTCVAVDDGSVDLFQRTMRHAMRLLTGKVVSQ